MIARLWKPLGLVLVLVLLTLSGIAAYDAWSNRGISRLTEQVEDLRDSVAIRDKNAAVADERSRLQSLTIAGLTAVANRQRDSLRTVTRFADSVRSAARPRRQVARVSVDTLFLGAVPYVVPIPVIEHVVLLESVIVADSVQRALLERHVGWLTALNDSLFQLDTTRLEQIAERDHSIDLRDRALATQDTIIRKKNPRCGRKCGIAIGHVGTLLAALAVSLLR